jgi:hypothetical protein
MQNLIPYPFILILSTFSFQSCLFEKEPDPIVCKSSCIIFDVFVPDLNNGMLLQDVEVTITHIDWKNVFFASSTKIGKTRTNGSGHFTFSFPGEKYGDGNGYFELTYKKNGYLLNDYDGKMPFFYIDSTSFDIPINANMALLPKAQLNIHLKVDSTKYKDLLCEVRYSNTGVYANYMAQIDTTYSYETAGDQFTNISYSYKRYGVLNHRKDSIFIKAGETGVHEIKLE